MRPFVHTSSTAAWSLRMSDVLTEDVPQRGAASLIALEVAKHRSEQLVRASAMPWAVLSSAPILGAGDRHTWARLIVMVDREALPGNPPGVGAFADVREVANAHQRPFERQRLGQGDLLGGARASVVALVHLVGEQRGRPLVPGVAPRARRHTRERAALLARAAGGLEQGRARAGRRAAAAAAAGGRNAREAEGRGPGGPAGATRRPPPPRRRRAPPSRRPRGARR